MYPQLSIWPWARWFVLYLYIWTREKSENSRAAVCQKEPLEPPLSNLHSEYARSSRWVGPSCSSPCHGPTNARHNVAQDGPHIPIKAYRADGELEAFADLRRTCGATGFCGSNCTQPFGDQLLSPEISQTPFGAPVSMQKR